MSSLQYYMYLHHVPFLVLVPCFGFCEPDCPIRGNELESVITDCLIRGNELQSERTSCQIRGNELLIRGNGLHNSI